MAEFDKFWAEQRRWLADDYSDDRGNVHCELLADDLAKILAREDKIPLLLELKSANVSESGKRETLVPLPYDGAVRWAGHSVCYAEGLVYDPILDEPVPLEEYGQKAFGQDIEIVDIHRPRGE